MLAMKKNNTNQRDILSVSQLNRQAKRLLEGQFPSVWIEGELSNLSRPSSGHWYFSLKDSSAQVRCAMFRNSNMRLRFQPASGQKVVIRAKLSLYEARGDYQLIAEYMEPAGAGDLARAFEELKNKLASEGIFNPEIKQALPEQPRHIAIVTSPTGAAIHDVLTVLKRRFPATAITILPTAVQGQGAAEHIARQIVLANQLVDEGRADYEVLIVGRGGGSQEDLWAFNEEVVARAIHYSQLPVVSAVGHEIDFPIADFTADARAATPSAAAEMLSPDGRDMLQTFLGHEQLLLRAINNTLADKQNQLNWSRSQLTHPGSKLNEQRQRLDELEIRLTNGWHYQHQQQQHRLQLLASQLQQSTPRHAVETAQIRLKALTQRLKQQIQQQLKNSNQQLDNHMQRLNTISPLATLERGYAVINQNDTVIINANQVCAGQKITAQLGSGSLDCTIDKVNH